MSAQPEPSDSDDAELEAEIQEGIADADAGRLTPWQAVRNWMMSWGTQNELPAPSQSSTVARPR